MRKTHQSTHSTICWLCGIPNRSYSIVPDTKVVRYPTKLNLESSWIDTKTHSFSTINPAFIQDKSKEGMQISLRYDYPLRKPIFWRAEIGRIRPIPTVIGSVNAYRTYRERLNTQDMISFMKQMKIFMNWTVGRTFRWLRIAGENSDTKSVRGKRSHQLG